MADHVSTTQQAFPGRAVARTVVQGIIGFLLTAGVVAPLVLSAADETLGSLIPERARGYIVAGVGVLVALSAFTARVMAIPAVDRFLKKIGLSSSPTA